MMQHTGPISGIATHLDHFVATAGYDNKIIIWDARSHTAVARSFHDHLANQCSFSRSGNWLVSASSDHSARVWSVPSLRLQAVLTGHSDDVEMASFSPDETLIATCSRDRTLRVYNREGLFQGVCEGHDDDVLSIVWSDDGRSLISSSDDGTVRLWDAHMFRETSRFDLHGAQTDTVAVTRDGSILAGDDLGRITLVRDGEFTGHAAHAAGIKRIVVDDVSRRAVSLSYDRSMAIWQLTEQGIVLLGRDAIPAMVWPRSAAFLGSNRLVFATFGASYQIYDLRERAWDESTIAPNPGLNAVAVLGGKRFSVGDAGIVWCDGQKVSEPGSLCNFLLSVGNRVLTGGQLGIVFDALTGEALYQHRSPVNCGTTLVVDGHTYAVIGSYTGDALLFRYNEATSELVFERALILHDNAIKGLAADSEFLFSVCASGAVAFHRLGELHSDAVRARGHTRIANGCVAIDGKFASVGRDMRLRIWRDGRQFSEFTTPHTHSIKCIAASEDGLRIATGSYGGTVAIFELSTQRWSTCIRPTAAGISSLSPARDGTNGFVASSYDGRLYSIC